MAGVAAAVVFVRRQRTLAYPLLDLALFRQPGVSAAITAYALSCLAMFGVYIFITQYLQLVLALTPLQAGLATLPWSLAFVVGSLLAPRLARSLPRLSVMVWGLAAAAVGMGLLAAVDAGPARSALPLLIVGTVAMSLGMAPVFTIGNEMIITAAPPERAGAASALSETASEFSGAAGIALFGSAGTFVYRHGLASAMPAGVPDRRRAGRLGDARRRGRHRRHAAGRHRRCTAGRGARRVRRCAADDGADRRGGRVVGGRDGQAPVAPAVAAPGRAENPLVGYRLRCLRLGDRRMNEPSAYTPPNVWSWNKDNGGRFANINRPTAGPTHERELPVGRHPLQLYSLGHAERRQGHGDARGAAGARPCAARSTTPG